jgi:tetraacyldisaccharide 4'-kinase
MPSILLVSNGHGEAAVAGYIANELARREPDATIEHFQLVGRAPSETWPPAVGPQANMPSGGLVTYGNARNVIRDVRTGLIGLSIRQFAFLRRQRFRDVVVAIGDVYCLAACLLFARRPTVFVATAKSERVAGHSRLECAIARKAAAVFARDIPTAKALAERGVRAQWVGNLMMDGIAHPLADALPIDASAVRFAVLPGSRSDAAANAKDAARRLRLIAAQLAARGLRTQAFVSVASTADQSAIMDAIASEGLERDGGRSGRACAADRSKGDVTSFSMPEVNLDLLVVSARFAELLAASHIVLGQAGTANEQAAGLGKPVVAAADDGPRPQRIGWYRERQRRLLGDALLVLPNDDRRFADGVIALLDDPARQKHMADIGRERMGEAGGAARVAECILTVCGYPT